MKRSTLILTGAMLLSTSMVNAQVSYTQSKIAKTLKKALTEKVMNAAKQNLDTKGMDIKTTKESQTTTYSYIQNNWKEITHDKYEYNKDGFITSNETKSTKTVNEYDSDLYGFITKSTLYTWNNTSSTWSDPTVTYSAELTRNSKGEVIQETIYVYYNDSQKLEKETDLNFTYGKDGKLKTISTAIEEDEVSVPITISDIKWYKYDGSRLFTTLASNNDIELLTDRHNMIESATISMTIEGISVKGNLKGSYTESQSKISLSIPFMGQTLMSLETILNVTDAYGSYDITVNTSSLGEASTSMKIEATNNEHGDCIKMTASNTDEDDGEDSNYSITTDYEYYTLNDGNVLKKSATTNRYDKNSQEYKPTTRVTYDEYVDYVSGTTDINKEVTEPLNNEINAVYSLEGIKVGKSLDKVGKGVYIVKKQGKTIKISK